MENDHSSNGGLLLRIVVVLCCIVTCCSMWHGYCDLDNECDWGWNESQGFKKVKALRTNLSRSFPSTDADNSSNGHFLWFNTVGPAQIWSKPIPRTGPHCRIEFWLYMVEMESGFINLVIQANNNVTSIAVTKSGNNNATWEKISFSLRAIKQSYKLILEVNLPHPNSSIGVDNLRLVNCFPESIKDCTKNMFRCNNGSCFNRTRVCDFTKDCADGEDEASECDKVPENAKCNFEGGWCGWMNISDRSLNWTRYSGPTPNKKTGPSYDHTYRNKTGVYAFVNMATKHPAVAFGSRATMTSPLYNPTPPYSRDPNSPYYRSCQVRFFYNIHGAFPGSLELFLIQVKPYKNYSENLWRSSGHNNDVWYNEAIALDVKYRYHLKFEATRGYVSRGNIAVDDISLSPECFGIGVPPEVRDNFNYYKPVIEFEKVPTKHPDFASKTGVYMKWLPWAAITIVFVGLFIIGLYVCYKKYQTRRNLLHRLDGRNYADHFPLRPYHGHESREGDRRFALGDNGIGLRA